MGPESVRNDVFSVLIDRLTDMHYLAIFMHMSEGRRLMGRGLGWVDMHLLASAVLASRASLDVR